VKIQFLLAPGLLLLCAWQSSSSTVAQPMVASSASAAKAAAATAANEPPPNTDVFLATLDLAHRKVGAPRNITHHDGYDNQPAFMRDGKSLLFVSDRNGATDVYRYAIDSDATTRVTATEEAEYSPTPLADNSGFSVIRVGKPNAEGTDSTNPPVWRYGFDGKPIGKIVDVLAVGYHAWLDPGHVALFVVGEEAKHEPNRLVLADVKTGKTSLLSEAPGRQLGRTPDGKRVSFVDKSDPKHWRVVAMAPGDKQPRFLVDTPKGPADEKEEDRSEDYCWLPDGSLLMAKGDTLLRWNGKPGSGLTPLAQLKDLGGDIKRLAVSRDGKRLAFVVQMRPH
jgi:hypothetical protein